MIYWFTWVKPCGGYLDPPSRLHCRAFSVVGPLVWNG